MIRFFDREEYIFWHFQCLKFFSYIFFDYIFDYLFLISRNSTKVQCMVSPAWIDFYNRFLLENSIVLVT